MSQQLIQTLLNMKIDITDERFMMERGKKNFKDYSQWDIVRQKSIDYRV